MAGSDAHTLRRVGRTWTSAPGRTRAELLESLRSGLGTPGGEHGGTAAVSGDAYGVVARYIAALAGVGPRDACGWRRVGCLAFSATSLPMQLLPLMIAAAGKSRERRQVNDVRARLLPAGAPAQAGMEA